jgi:hypothetical protein
MNDLYLNVEDGNIIWYQTGHKGQQPGDQNDNTSPAKMTINSIT